MMWLAITGFAGFLAMLVRADRSQDRAEKIWNNVRSGKIKTIEIESGGKGITAQGSITVNGEEYKVEDLVSSSYRKSD